MRLGRSFKLLAVLLAFVLLVVVYVAQRGVQHNEPEKPTVFVHLFEWAWPDIANECETFLGAHGYAAVQISPPHEHVVGDPWWTRYQPVSYRLESRGGTRAQFEDMVRRCNAAGVDIYADAVINHMSAISEGAGEGVGVAGSLYRRYEYPVPYEPGDFHRCGRYDDDMIRNYQDAWEVRNCELGGLNDLKTGEAAVQEKIAAYLADLLDTGVAGFRIDAAKHMEPADITAILDRLPGQPFVFQEVIDRGNEPIKGEEYTANGHVTELKYGMALSSAFSSGQLGGLESLGSADGWLPSELAVISVDNHDVQRGHAGAEGILTHKDWKTYELANIFMLAWPYGYPKVMSSYQFDDSDQGPPSIRPVGSDGACNREWVCEHRSPAIVAMVGFRNRTDGQPVTGWRQLGPSAIAFSRGDRGFVAINAGQVAVSASVPVGLAPGRYRNLLEGAVGADGSVQAELVVDREQNVLITLPPLSAIATDAGTADQHDE